MLLLYVLFGTYLFTLVASRIIKGEFKSRIAGRAGFSAVLLLTGVGHFIYPEGLVMMMPESIPFKLEWVYITGVIELAAAIGLLIPKTQKLTAWLLIVFLVLIFPCNIYAAMHHVDFQKATNDGSGIEYLWFRIPLQLFFIGWTYYFGIYVDRKKQVSL